MLTSTYKWLPLLASDYYYLLLLTIQFLASLAFQRAFRSQLGQVGRGLFLLYICSKNKLFSIIRHKDYAYFTLSLTYRQNDPKMTSKMAPKWLPIWVKTDTKHGFEPIDRYLFKLVIFSDQMLIILPLHDPKTTPTLLRNAPKTIPTLYLFI